MKVITKFALAACTVDIAPASGTEDLVSNPAKV
jgi:hypothetical protein